MKSRRCPCGLIFTVLLSITFIACAPIQNGSVSLASFTENYVEVLIYLQHDSDGEYVLFATFTPPEGYHLYSKDIPVAGIEGLGRPTLLALTSNSFMKANGVLTENTKPEVPEFEPRELLVYPLGAVTLSLSVELPPGRDWFDAEVEVTYMACSASLCKPPVVGKIVPVRVPGADRLGAE